jgi:hypothetical protein
MRLPSTAVTWVLASLTFIALGWLLMTALPPRLYPPIATPDVASAGLIPKELFELQTKRLELQGALRLTILQSLAVLAAVSGAVLAWQQARRERHEKQQDFRLQLFVEGLNALSEDSKAIRIGGIYTLNRLALSPEHGDASVQVLAAFIREGSPRERSKPTTTDTSANGKSASALSGDVQKALDVLVDLREIGVTKTLPLGHLELRSAVFKENALLEGTDFRGTSLYRASLKGAKLARADLTEVDLRHADLSAADLRACILKDADFSGVKYDGWQVGPVDPDEEKTVTWPQGFKLPESAISSRRAAASTER